VYNLCEFCKVSGGERRKSLPFGHNREEAAVLFVLPHFFDSCEQVIQNLLIEAYPAARFVTYTACGNVEDFSLALLACQILLRNEKIGFKRIMLPKQLFEESQTKIEEGVAYGFYDGNAPLKSGAIDEYRRILNAEV